MIRFENRMNKIEFRENFEFREKTEFRQIRLKLKS